MSVDRTQAKNEWKIHKRFSWFFYVVLMIASLVMAGVGMRFLKPPAVISMIFTLSLMQFGIFLFSGKIVIALMGCRELSEEENARIRPIVEQLVIRSGLKTIPALFVSKMKMPNAFAFGSGLVGGHGIGVTEPLLECLNEQELESVLAHELGHIRSKDTAFMTMISVSITIMNKFAGFLTNVGRLALVLGILIELIVYLPRVLAAAITQLREYAADAYSAHLTGEVEPLIHAFEKMQEWHEKKDPKKEDLLSRIRHQKMDELLLSHPDMQSRIRMLRRIKHTGETHESV